MKGNSNHNGQAYQRERTRINTLVKSGKASKFLPYRTLEETIERSGIP